MSEDVSKIAASLSRGQQARLHSIAELRASGKSWASAWGSLAINTSRATTPVLLRLGLIRNDDGYADTTPLGLAVRAHLLETVK